LELKRLNEAKKEISKPQYQQAQLQYQLYQPNNQNQNQNANNPNQPPSRPNENFAVMSPPVSFPSSFPLVPRFNPRNLTDNFAFVKENLRSIWFGKAIETTRIQNQLSSPKAPEKFLCEHYSVKGELISWSDALCFHFLSVDDSLLTFEGRMSGVKVKSDQLLVLSNSYWMVLTGQALFCYDLKFVGLFPEEIIPLDEVVQIKYDEQLKYIRLTLDSGKKIYFGSQEEPDLPEWQKRIERATLVAKYQGDDIMNCARYPFKTFQRSKKTWINFKLWSREKEKRESNMFSIMLQIFPPFMTKFQLHGRAGLLIR